MFEQCLKLPPLIAGVIISLTLYTSRSHSHHAVIGQVCGAERAPSVSLQVSFQLCIALSDTFPVITNDSFQTLSRDACCCPRMIMAVPLCNDSRFVSDVTALDNKGCEYLLPLGLLGSTMQL